MRAGTSCEHVFAIAAWRAALALLLLALAQATHETDIDFLVSFALLQSDAVIPVSYTHLTLPTICSV